MIQKYCLRDKANTQDREGTFFTEEFQLINVEVKVRQLIWEINRQSTDKTTRWEVTGTLQQKVQATDTPPNGTQDSKNKVPLTKDSRHKG